jgi:hypothetical protein
MNTSETLKFHNAKLEITKRVLAELHSLGRQGLSALLRMFLPVVSNSSHPHDLQKLAKKIANEGVQNLFDSFITDEKSGRLTDELMFWLLT